ncbi:MAG: SEC-C metal-binding domain-containing protein [Planctomycetota bacterium]
MVGRAEKCRDFRSEQKADLTASIIRLCLEADASSRIAYEGAEGNPEIIPFPAGNSRVGRNAPCPCGSGKKYKKCCGR